jgi:hypothetical protein
MSAIIHIASNGTIQLPPEILAHVQPNTPYSVHTENSKLVLEPAPAPRDLESGLTPAQRAAAYRQWADSHFGGPGLPDAAFNRDSIYD